jgi:hypothetical protein
MQMNEFLYEKYFHIEKERFKGGEMKKKETK